jgi:hypothetical protein
VLKSSFDEEEVSRKLSKIAKNHFYFDDFPAQSKSKKNGEYERPYGYDLGAGKMLKDVDIDDNSL